MGRVKYKLDGKRVLRSRHEAELMLGRPLKPEEVVHHKDENPSNDSRSNLQVLPNQAAHAKLHRLGKRIKRSEHTICAGCGAEFRTPRHGKARKYCSALCYRYTLKGPGNPNFKVGKHVKPR